MIYNRKTYEFEENDFNAARESFAFTGEECEVIFTEQEKEIRIKSGLNQWITGENYKGGNTLFALPGRTPMPTKISSHYHWSDQNTLVMKLKYVENIHHDIFTFLFSDQSIELKFDNSLSIMYENSDPRSPIKANLMN